MPEHHIDYLAPAAIKPRSREWRTHTPRQLDFMCSSLRARGAVEFPLVDSEDRLVCGSLIVDAAKAIGLNQIPVLRIDGMTDAELREYALAAARIAEMSGMDEALIGEELRELELLLTEPDFASLGWESAELDRILNLTDNDLGLADDEIFEPSRGPAVSQSGDRWLMGEHVLTNADSLDEANFRLLLGDELSRFTLTDGPYNLPASAISGNGRFQHEDFVMGAGEMSPAEFTRFWTRVMRNISCVSMDGSLHAFFMGSQFLLFSNFDMMTRLGLLYSNRMPQQQIGRVGSSPNVMQRIRNFSLPSFDDISWPSFKFNQQWNQVSGPDNMGGLRRSFYPVVAWPRKCSPWPTPERRDRYSVGAASVKPTTSQCSRQHGRRC